MVHSGSVSPDLIQIKCRSCRQLYRIDERIMSCVRCTNCGKIVTKPKAGTYRAGSIECREDSHPYHKGRAGYF